MSDSNPASEVVDAIDAYLSYLSLSDDRRRALRARVLDAGPVDRGAAIERLQSELEKAPSEPELEDDDRELLGRLHDSYPKLSQDAETRPPTAGALRSAAMPPLNRWPMSPADIDRRPWRLLPWLGRRRSSSLPKSVPSRLKGVVRRAAGVRDLLSKEIPGCSDGRAYA